MSVYYPLSIHLKWTSTFCIKCIKREMVCILETCGCVRKQKIYPRHELHSIRHPHMPSGWQTDRQSGWV
jgi:hypothetical protein